MVKLNTSRLKECLFYEKLENSLVKCNLCPHNCVINQDKTGICNTRINIKGILYTLTYGKPISISIDPIEKKPLFGFHSGEKILSIGTIGCNFKCKFCQNYDISQSKAINFLEKIETVTPEQIIEKIKQKKLNLIAFTYNEPIVFYEYMIDIAKLAKQNDIECVIVSNGFISPEPLKELCKYISAANIDLKSFNKKFYKNICSARLEPVLETLKILKENNIHIEVTNLILESKNDSLDEIEKIAVWIKENLGEDTILHLSRAFPMYKMQDIMPTPIVTLYSAQEVCKHHLSNVFIGNV